VFGVEHGDVAREGLGVETFGFREGEKFGPLVQGLGEGAASGCWGVVFHYLVLRGGGICVFRGGYS